jgi:hypothetical protein
MATLDALTRTSDFFISEGSDIQLLGGAAWLQTINSLRGAANRDGRTRWAVATAIGDAPYNELRKPHWRVASIRMSTKGLTDQYLPGVQRRRTSQNTIRNGEREWELWFEPSGSAGGQLARAFQEEVRRVIDQKNIKITGTYRASIAWGASINAALNRSRQQAQSHNSEEAGKRLI